MVHKMTNFSEDTNKLTELGHSNLYRMGNTLELKMMGAPSTIRLMRVHGKDGIWKDTETMFMSKVPDLHTTIGLHQVLQELSNKCMEELLKLL